MKLVIDLGCADRGQWNSLAALAAAYHPDLIIGLDPSPQLDTTVTEVAGVPVELHNVAAWTHNGTVPFEDDLILGGSGPRGYAPYTPHSTGRIGTIGEGHQTVTCVDFNAWLADRGIANDREIDVLKMDIEGAEYGLLDHMLAGDTIRLARELVIEWHDHPDDRIVNEVRAAGVVVTPWWM